MVTGRSKTPPNPRGRFHQLPSSRAENPKFEDRSQLLNGSVQLGSRLRTARRNHHLSIDQVARATGLTKGFISQLERDMTSASVASLLRICNALRISIGSLFDPPKTNLVRGPERPQINFGGEFVTEYLLTPSGNDHLQVIQSHLEPGGGGGVELYSLDADTEVVHVVAGSVEITVNDEHYVLNTGDTLTFSAREPHTWRNASSREAAEVLWILAPSPW